MIKQNLPKSLIFCMLFLFSFSLVNAYSIDNSENAEFYYSFDNETTNGVIEDLSPNGNNGICNNMGTNCNLTTGIIGQAISFDGINDYLISNSSTSSEYNGKNPRSYSFWWYYDESDRGQNGYLTSVGGGISNQMFTVGVFDISGTENNVFFDFYNNFIASDYNLTANRWNHLVVNYEEVSNNLSLYVNNERVYSVINDDFSSTNTQLRLGSRFTNAGYSKGLMDEFYLYNYTINESEIETLYSLGFPTTETLNITSTNPDNSSSFNWDNNNISLNLETNLNSVCSHTYESVTNNFTNTNSTNHSDTLNIETNFNETKTHTINFECINNENSSDIVTTQIEFTQNIQPFNITLNSPTPNTNYTFDVQNFTIEVETSYNDSSCELTNDSNTYSMSTSDNTIHTYLFDMGQATNETKTFEIAIECSSPSSSSNETLSNFTVYQQQEPLELDILIPQQNQEFSDELNQVEFNIETNYIANCNYESDNVSFTNFTQTNSSVHKTNFTDINENVNVYNISFTCFGVFLDETVEQNRTFLLVSSNGESGLVTVQNSLTDTTGQLPQVGNDISRFLNNLSPGVIAFMFGLSVLAIILVLITALVFILRKSINNYKIKK